jgi:RNase P/RNase MRP subunit POP5
MPAKDKKPRKRYIAFKVNAPCEISRKDFISAIRKKVTDQNQWERVEPWLTVFENNEGILRCIHKARDEAVEILTSIKNIGMENVKITVETLGTSGTIKKAKLRYLGLNDK